MCNERPVSSAPPDIPPGVALMADDFPGRLEAVRDLLDLNWEEMAVALGVDPRQLLRWRIKGGNPNGGAMLSLVRLAIRSGGVGGASGRGRNRDLQTEKEEQ